MAHPYIDFVRVLNLFFSDLEQMYNCRCATDPAEPMADFSGRITVTREEYEQAQAKAMSERKQRKEAATHVRARREEQKQPGYLMFRVCRECGGYFHHSEFLMVDGICAACGGVRPTRGECAIDGPIVEAV